MRSIITLIFLALSGAAFAQRTCATMQVLEKQLQQYPEMRQRMDEIERHTQSRGQMLKPSETVITIPVVYHIIHNGQPVGTDENISDALIMAQMEQLNADFSLMNSDVNLIPQEFQPLAANTNIQFCLAQRKPDQSPTNGIERINGGLAEWSTDDIDNILKPATIWDRDQYLNVWVVRFDANGPLGYAQFPGGPASTDGVVVVYYSVGSLTLANPNDPSDTYNKGRTMTHEVGHWINLRHIWGDAICGDDLVGDTPVHYDANYSCPTYPHTNTCLGYSTTEMTMDYMDYVDDVCMQMFSAGQSTRMRAVLEAGGGRESLASSPGCLPPSANCDLAITNVATSAASCPGAPDGTITVTATSSNGPISYVISGPSNQSNSTGVFSGVLAGNYTVEVTDANNCTSSTNTVVSAGLDNTPPTIICPNPVTVVCATQVPPVDLTAVNAADNCGTPVKSHVSDIASNITCANRKTITRTYKATDASNNTKTCTQVITVFDNVAPTFTSVPANVTVQCNAVPAPGNPVVADGCGGMVTVAYNGQTQTNGNCPNSYILTRQWTATDACGNTKTATQKITVVDLMAPVFTTVPANVTVQCNAVPPVGSPAATDGCSGVVSITYNGQTTTAGPCPDTYTLTRKWTATDVCSNTRTVTQRITVVDTQKPAFTFVPAPVTVECSDPVPPVGTPTSTDNCDASVSIALIGQYTTGAPAPNATLLVRVWKATDNCGNYVTASQVITIQDTQKPVFTSVPPPITIECSDLFPVTPGTATATDNCDASVQVSFSGQTSAPGNCPQGYVVTRTWTAYDDAGNTRTAQQAITVVDTKAPVFTNAPANVTIACGASLPPVPVVTASDACDNTAPATFVGETSTGPNCPYTVTRTWTVSDDCGNATTYMQVITVSGQSFNGSGANPQPVTRNPQPATLQLAPNPARNAVWISFDLSAEGEAGITLTGLDGRLVAQQQVSAATGTNRYQLDLSSVPAGVYVVRLQANGLMAAEKLVVFRN